MSHRDLHVTANRLRHHLLEWGDTGPAVLLLHGFLEHAHVWDWIAPRLAEAGYHVYALDWRGHGDSDWVGTGGYYHFADYVADLAFLVPELGGRVALVAHSMGGGAAVLYAGTEPQSVTALVSIEGLGPPDSDPEVAPDRFTTWVGDLERVARRSRPPLSLDAAAAMLRERFPRFSPPVARHMALHGSREVEGGRQWKFDPLHQSSSPQPFYVVQARAFWRRVTCPVLFVEGADSGLRLGADDLDDRLGILRARCAVIAGAAHHPHLERPDELTDVLLTFLASAVPRTGGAPDQSG